MKEMQFSVVVVMVLMCSALILLMPKRVKRDKVSNRSRWLMTGYWDSSACSSSSSTSLDCGRWA